MPVGMVIKMSYLEKMRPEHYLELYEVLREHDPTFDVDSYDQFVCIFNGLSGWTVMRDGMVIGMIALSHHTPGHDIMIHFCVDPGHRGRWVTRTALKTLFGHIFTTLGLVRATTLLVVGLNDEALRRVTEHLGFRAEGKTRKGIKIKGQFMDVITFGMLREECKWA
jgi:RimJ/RimL family protein N-acetyltransferase